MSVCRPIPAQNSLLTHSQKKTGPEKQAGRVMKKQMAPARNHYSLARTKNRPAKNKPPLSPGPREPRAFNILCSGSPIPIPRQPPGCFFLGWVPSRAPARNHYSLTRRKKNRPGKTGRPSNEKTNRPSQKSLLTHSQKKTGPQKQKAPQPRL